MDNSTIAPHPWGRNLSIDLASSLPVTPHGLLVPKFRAFSHLGSLHPGVSPLSIPWSWSWLRSSFLPSRSWLPSSPGSHFKPHTCLRSGHVAPCSNTCHGSLLPWKESPCSTTQHLRSAWSHLPPLPHLLPTKLCHGHHIPTTTPLSEWFLLPGMPCLQSLCVESLSFLPGQPPVPPSPGTP